MGINVFSVIFLYAFAFPYKILTNLPTLSAKKTDYISRKLAFSLLYLPIMGKKIAAKRKKQHEIDDVKGLSPEDVVVKYAPLVKLLARRMIHRLPPNIDINDLISAGLIGLVEAYSKFDASKGFHFNTFAEHRIRGAMLDELRKQDWMPRSQRTKIKKVKQAVTRLETEENEGHGPCPKRIASMTGLKEKEVEAMVRNESFNIEMVSLDSMGDGAHIDDERHFVSKQRNDPFANICKVNTLEIIQKTFEHMPENEAEVLYLYYFVSLSQKEIAAKLQLTESRVSQIHRKALKTLNELFGDIEADLTTVA